MGLQQFGFPWGPPTQLNATSPPRAPEAPHTAIEDRSETRFRVESIDIGIRLTLLMCAAGVLYAFYTWHDRSGRQLIGSLLGISAAFALLVYLLPHEKIVRSRWREPFFLTWSVLNIGLITVVVGADKS